MNAALSIVLHPSREPLMGRRLLYAPHGMAGTVIDVWHSPASGTWVRLAFDGRNHRACRLDECEPWLPPFGRKGPRLVASGGERV